MTGVGCSQVCVRLCVLQQQYLDSQLNGNMKERHSMHLCVCFCVCWVGDLAVCGGKQKHRLVCDHLGVKSNIDLEPAG